MTIIESITKHGARYTAKLLVNQRTQNLCGLSVDDLPDSSEMCDVIDNLEEVLNDIDDTVLPGVYKDNIRETLRDVNLDMIERLVYE